MPDIVALQELDLGRRRSRTEDQAAIIARETGLQVVFCPTITRGDEHYGHAVFSAWPMEIVKRARLPHDPQSWWQEPRSAIWVRVDIDGRVIHVITAHLGLGPHERVLQIEALIGPDWIGGIPRDEPVLLCGDFNCMPGSRPHRIARERLADVQLLAKPHRPLATFSSLQPLVRIDHIFVSPHFEPATVRVVRNDVTRVASDHLPLVAELRVAPAPGDTSRRTRQELPPHTPAAEPAELR
jgi:endonuclease/exonuclease/phosphatase family metal-dependent hydrolase